MADGKMLYFSVKFTTKMMGLRFIPSVCYKIDDRIRGAVEKLAAQGEARLYPEEMRFVSGAALPVKNRPAEAPALSSVSARPGTRKERDFS